MRIGQNVVKVKENFYYVPCRLILESVLKGHKMIWPIVSNYEVLRLVTVNTYIPCHREFGCKINKCNN